MNLIHDHKQQEGQSSPSLPQVIAGGELEKRQSRSLNEFSMLLQFCFIDGVLGQTIMMGRSLEGKWGQIPQVHLRVLGL